MIQFICGLIIGEVLGVVVMGLCIAGNDDYSDYDLKEDSREKRIECLGCDFWRDFEEEFE